MTAQSNEAESLSEHNTDYSPLKCPKVIYHPVYLVEDDARRIIGATDRSTGGLAFPFNGAEYSVGLLMKVDPVENKEYIAMTVMNGTPDMVKGPVPSWARGAM